MNTYRSTLSSDITFSIIIPIYNSSAYVSECITSIVNQTYKNHEVILVNDGSTDDSLEKILAFKNANNNIIVLNKENAGVSAARNDGIERAIGQYILFIDSDDYLLDHNALEKLKNACNKNADLIMFNTFYENQPNKGGNKDQVLENKKLDKYLFDVLKNEKMNAAFNKVYLREIIAKHHIRFNEQIKIGEDLLFNIKYLRYCKSIYYLSDYLYFYRTTNTGSTTKKYIENKYDHLMHVNDKLQEWLHSKQSPKLLNLAKYLRIKYIVSCVRDVTHPKAPLNKRNNYSQVKQYKVDNPRIIVKGCGIKLYTISLLYSFMNIVLLGRIINKVYGERK